MLYRYQVEQFELAKKTDVWILAPHLDHLAWDVLIARTQTNRRYVNLIDMHLRPRRRQREGS